MPGRKMFVRPGILNPWAWAVYKARPGPDMVSRRGRHRRDPIQARAPPNDATSALQAVRASRSKCVPISSPAPSSPLS